MKRRLALICALTASAMSGAIAADSMELPESGPENHGLRLRLVAAREMTNGEETFRVRLDLINTTQRPITLTADWPYDQNKGDFREYIEACTSIETFPRIGGWEGQVMADHRALPQPQLELPARGVTTVEWQATDRKLKNTVVRPLEVQNPRFPSDGLYSVHAVAVLRTGNGKCVLRSNEQQVPVGGSRTMPKHPFGTVVRADADANTVTLDLGALQKIAVGDKFLIRTGMGDFWRMEVNRVGERQSTGKLTPADQHGRVAPDANPRFPRTGISARLILQ
jgi:hypothetical protein